jgi:CCR4-NOT transcription complex subunit 7/8
MSKSNTNKKLITNYSSPYLIPQNKEKIKKPSPNPHPPVLEIFQTKEENDRLGIMEVYEDNFIEQIKYIGDLLDEYNYIGMDTEFPGTVFHVENMTEDFYYKSLKKNVDKLKLIQLGITLTNDKGEYPNNSPYHTWQFNLEFDKDTELYKDESMDMLKKCGINFDKLKKKGIKHNIFAQYFMVSNLVLNPDVHWVSFHGTYDFGYLLKLLINSDLPQTEDEFVNKLNLYFINFYDIRVMVKDNDNLFKKSLKRLAEMLEVRREGQEHQAGSDSMVTIDVFFKLKKKGLISETKIQEVKNILYGVGMGQANDETITYTQIGNLNMNYQNNNSNNMMYINMPNLANMPINSNYINMNLYNYSMLLNNQTNLPLHKNNTGLIPALI